MSDTFTVGGHRYQCSKMVAMDQFHVARRLTPVLKSFDGVLRAVGDQAAKSAQAGLTPEKMNFADLLGSIEPFLSALHDMPDADVEYIIGKCLAVVTRQDDGGTGWAPIVGRNSSRPMFDDIDVVVMLTITANVLRENLSHFTTGLPSALSQSR